MRNSLCLLLSFIPIFLLGQNAGQEYRNYIKSSYDHIIWSGEQYPNSIRGLEIILEDLEEVDYELFEVLSADMKKYKLAKIAGNRMMIIGGIGTTIGLVGLVDLESKRSRQNTNLALLLTAVSIGIGIKGIRRKPNSKRFIYRFTRILNTNNSGKKVEFSMQPKINFGINNSVGLSLYLNF